MKRSNINLINEQVDLIDQENKRVGNEFEAGQVHTEDVFHYTSVNPDILELAVVSGAVPVAINRQPNEGAETHNYRLISNSQEVMDTLVEFNRNEVVIALHPTYINPENVIDSISTVNETLKDEYINETSLSSEKQLAYPAAARANLLLEDIKVETEKVEHIVPRNIGAYDRFSSVSGERFDSLRECGVATAKLQEQEYRHGSSKGERACSLIRTEADAVKAKAEYMKSDLYLGIHPAYEDVDEIFSKEDEITRLKEEYKISPELLKDMKTQKTKDKNDDLKTEMKGNNEMADQKKETQTPRYNSPEISVVGNLVEDAKQTEPQEGKDQYTYATIINNNNMTKEKNTFNIVAKGEVGEDLKTLKKGQFVKVNGYFKAEPYLGQGKDGKPEAKVNNKVFARECKVLEKNMNLDLQQQNEPAADNPPMDGGMDR